MRIFLNLFERVDSYLATGQLAQPESVASWSEMKQCDKRLTAIVYNRSLIWSAWFSMSASIHDPIIRNIFSYPDCESYWCLWRRVKKDENWRLWNMTWTLLLHTGNDRQQKKHVEQIHSHLLSSVIDLVENWSSHCSKNVICYQSLIIEFIMNFGSIIIPVM